MAGKPTPRGSWGDWATIEYDLSSKRISCAKCRNYCSEDGSCFVKMIKVSEIGYNFWKHCDSFKMDDMYQVTKVQYCEPDLKKIGTTHEKTHIEQIIEDSPISSSDNPLRMEFTRKLLDYTSIGILREIHKRINDINNSLSRKEIKIGIVLMLIKEEIITNTRKYKTYCDRPTLQYMLSLRCPLGVSGNMSLGISNEYYENVRRKIIRHYINDEPYDGHT